MKKLAVVAFGGNALLRAGQTGTIDEQKANAFDASKKLVKLIKKYNLVLTHGNGPQVGNILIANAAGHKYSNIPEMPLDVCGAYSQGFIGYVLEQQLRNVLKKQDKERDIITLITQVVVDKNDPAFKNPTKPIGPYYTKEEAEAFMEKDGSVLFKEDSRGRGWRKVVASPEPLIIFNKKSIEKIAREGNIVIAVGGGGIPCYYVDENKLEGIEAVIDKDLASSRLAIGIRADKFFILTDIPKVFINFNTPQEKAIDKMSILEAKQYVREGQFGEGSMLPKVRAAINFVENTGKDAIITETTKLGIDNGGTRITMI